MSKNLGDDLDFDEISRVINVNAIGTLRVTNALSSLVLNSTEKTIVNISSEAGSIADCWRTGWFGYCMSKTANNMQSALVHNNIQKLGGKVFAIHPGHVATYMRGHLEKEFYMLFWICLIQLIRAHFIWITLEKNFRGKANIYLSRTKG